MKILISLFCLMNVFTSRAGHLEKVMQDWPKARELAKEEHKLILIDFYTTWCGPCKRLNKDIFEDSATASEISKNFILLKYDAEKDSMFHLTMKFHVNAYPTSMIVSHDLRVFHKMIGYQADTLDKYYLDFLKEGFDKYQKGQFYAGISSKIDLGFPDFYKKIVLGKSKIKAEKSKIEEYWKTHTDVEDELNFAILSYTDVNEKMGKLILEKRELLKSKFPTMDVDNLAEDIMAKKFREAIAHKSEPEFESAKQFAIKNLDLEAANNLEKHYTKDLYMAMGEWKKYVEIIEKEMGPDPKPSMVNFYCWEIYENCTDHGTLKMATKWMETAMNKAADWAGLDTYARLQYKTGDRSNAIKTMKQAIQMGVQEKAKVQESEQELKKWEASKDTK